MRARGKLLAAVVAAGLAVPSAAGAASDPIDQAQGLRDRDVRTSVQAPPAARRSAARSLGDVTWTRFGTPASLVAPGGTLGANVKGADAAAASRQWIGQHRSLYGLSLSSLAAMQVLNDSKLTGSDAHAVTFQQYVGGLPAAGGGLLTIGLAPSGGSWRVASAMGDISPDTTLAGKASLSAEEALQRAATDAGTSRSLAQIRSITSKKLTTPGMKSFSLSGVQDVQRVRAVAFPRVNGGFVSAYEAEVANTGGVEPQAYRSIVDANSGEILSRVNLVDNASDAAPAAATDATFSGTLPPQDGGCDTRKGPYTVAAGDNVRALTVFADADNKRQDIVIHLFRGNEELLEGQGDTGLTPERIRYEPKDANGNPTGVPAGDYFVQICEFPGQSQPVEPRTYQGTVTFDTTAAPKPYTARWDTFPANPPLNAVGQDPWNNPSTDTREEWCWTSSAAPGDCDRVIGNLASRSPWDFDVKSNTTTDTTTGNNAHSAESWTDDSVPAPNQFHPTATDRDYTFPWTNAWNTSDCNPGSPYGSAFQVGKSFDISAAVTNLFVMHNRMHDWSYFLGFTEQNWNAQDSNFGLTEQFRENDAVTGDAQAGATTAPPGVYANARNNANMATLADGLRSVTNMYLWQPVAGAFYPPCVDGDYDAGVIGHEYGHMIENRMIGKGQGRVGFQAGAMGEAVGDLMSIEQLNETGSVPTGGENRYATGTYATGNPLRGIRNYAANFPSQGAFPTPSTYPEVDPLNFSDIGYDTPGPEVHSDGEIWVAINFEVRKALNAKYDAQFPSSNQTLQNRCAIGQLPVDQCPGSRRWIQLLFDSYLLDPVNPSMVQARDSMLAADTLRFNGADLTELRAAFARRGLGKFAASTNGTGRAGGVESDTNPKPDFEADGQGNAPVTFQATTNDAAHTPVNARIFVGHYEARVSPIADTDPSTNAPATNPPTANNLDATANFAPGTYEFIATAPGYGAVRFRRTFTADTPAALVIRFAPNWASKSQGAKAEGTANAVISGANGATVRSRAQVLSSLIDDTEATDWQAAAVQSGSSYVVSGRNVIVDLGGGTAHAINRVQVSAELGPVFDPAAGDVTQNRFTALRDFDIRACNAQVSDCSKASSFTRVYNSAADFFPADAPRPVAPMLLLREARFATVQATHLQIVVHNSQCTGGPAYQGEQDADPFNATDCNSAGPAATRFVRAAELQAFGADSVVEGG
jgi:extracellular elastinolytic metalloproteinase